MTKRTPAQLSVRQERFVHGILGGLSQREAYERAGYVARGAAADVQASRLVRNPKVAARLESERRRLRERADVDADRVTREFARVAFLDPGGVVHVKKVEDIAELPRDVRAAISGWKWDSDGRVVIKFFNKLDALDKLARHLGLYQDDGESVGRDGERLTKTVFWRFVASFHLSRDIPFGQAYRFAEGHPELVEEWGREHGILEGGQRAGGPTDV